jgi:LPS-assembly protein
VHDARAQQIYFSEATLRFYGLPILYLPVLRVPDPTLNRATGFLIPSLRSTSALGAGLKMPYFITLGSSRDLMVTPYLTARGDATLNLRYRQAFTNGTIQFDGAVTGDDLGPSNPRGYVQAEGAFTFARNYKLTFHGVAVSDPAYLLDYGISDEDRLDSRVGLARVKRDLYFSAQLIGFQSLRASESTQTLPSVVTDLTIHRRFEPEILGGEGEFQVQAYSAYRSSNSTLDGNGDGIADGRDIGRITLRGSWWRNWTADNGIALSALADLSADYYSIAQDPAYDGRPSRATGTAGVELRWPWVKANAAGATQMIGPVLQIVVAPRPDNRIPNEDSSLVEFDESNLFALDRFPGSDAFEGGARANIGFDYLRSDPGGLTLGITAGRVIRPVDLGQFSVASGLNGQKSDWLLAWGVQNADGVSLTNRLLLSDDLSLTKAELRFDLARPRYSLSGGYEYLLADPAENRPDRLSELVLDARYDLTRNWSAGLANRYDLVAHRATRAGLVMTFQNECVDFNLSLSRRYTSSTNVRPSTDFGLSVELLGFGGGSAAGAAKVCRR